VTVLLPVFNAGAPLQRAIESILAQDFADFEFLIIDDASNDGSAEAVRSWAARDSRIRAVFHDANAGLAATLNEGLRLARGELVARMDQDDESLRNRVRVQAEFMRAHPHVVVAGTFVYHMGAKPRYDRLVTFATDAKTIREALRTANPLYHPSVILRRREILDLGGYRDEFRNAEDYDLWLRASKRYDLAVIPEPLLRYRFSPHGMSLGRKWEQLYFVYLAQAANNEGGLPLEEARHVAQRMLEETDREQFLVQVAQATMSELGALRLWRDVATLGERLVRDVGLRAALRVFRAVMGIWAHAAARSLRRLLRSPGVG
jgi:glycosyltransferase involved in cell wall biosynthesis